MRRNSEGVGADILKLGPVRSGDEQGRGRVEERGWVDAHEGVKVRSAGLHLLYTFGVRVIQDNPDATASERQGTRVPNQAGSVAGDALFVS